MSTELPDRDERTAAIENEGYRWSYLTLSFGLLAITVYRRFALGEATWDLLALVITGGVVNAAYQARGQVLSPRWFVLALATVAVAALLAVALAFGWGSR
jgi:hypothetical protein